MLAVGAIVGKRAHDKLCVHCAIPPAATNYREQLRTVTSTNTMDLIVNYAPWT